MDSFFSQSSFRRSGNGVSIYRRAYSQNFSGIFWRPDPGVMRTVWTLISLNTAVFGAWQYAEIKKDAKLRKQLYENATLMDANIQAGRGWTMITSAFSHKDFFHFLFNMVTLNAFGTILAMVPGVGAVKVMGLAFGSAVAGSSAWLYHLGTKQQTSNKRARDTGIFSRFGGGTVIREVHVGLGASGMVMGMGAAATCLVPFAPMNLMLIPIPIPLWLLTAGYFGVDAYYLNSDSKIGHSAHLGGAIFGAVYYLGLLRNYGGVWRMLRRVIRR